MKRTLGWLATSRYGRIDGILLLSLLIVGLAFIPLVQAQGCLIQFTRLSFPAKLDPGNSLEVKGELSVTCSQPGVDVSGRADLVERQSGRVLSRVSFHLGYVVSPQSNWTHTFSVGAQAPSASGIWKLAVNVTLLGGSQTWSAHQAIEIQVGERLPEQTKETVILPNGDFESSLLYWQTVNDGGHTAVSHSVSRSGNSSLHLDLPPTASIRSAEAQGVLQAVSVEKLRALSIEAWLLTPSCSLPTGIVGRLRIQVGQLTLRYDSSGTCGEWRRIYRNVTADFQSTFGLEGAVPFQQEDLVQIVVGLELVRSQPNAMALAAYTSIYWDDIKLIAWLRAQSTVETTASSTTTSMTSTSIGSTTTATQVSPERPYASGWTNAQVYGFIAATLAITLGLIVLAVRVKLGRMSSSRLKSESEKTCPECSARVPPYRDVRYCQECGAELTPA